MESVHFDPTRKAGTPELFLSPVWRAVNAIYHLHHPLTIAYSPSTSTERRSRAREESEQIACATFLYSCIRRQSCEYKASPGSRP